MGLNQREQHLIISTIWKANKNFDHNLTDQELKKMRLDELETRLMSSDWQTSSLSFDSLTRMEALLETESDMLDTLLSRYSIQEGAKNSLRKEQESYAQKGWNLSYDRH